MWQLRYGRLSLWDIAYAIDMALACLITYWLMKFVFHRVIDRPSDLIGVLWAVIATVYVFRDTRDHALTAGLGRLIATCVSFVLCLVYTLLFPFTPFGMAAVLVLGTLIMTALDRRADIGLTAVTTAVIMIVVAIEPRDAWHQPMLRLFDTVVGIAVGMTCKWIASFVFFKMKGEQAR